jgi:branched-chain amino acid aminotransferase
MENLWVFFKDKFFKAEEAKISIMTNALQYGTGVFGGIRGYYNKSKKAIFVFRLQDHYQRFLNSLKILGVSIKYN